MSIDNDELTTGATWVVVADASRAEIFSRTKRRSPLEAVQLLEEPAARAREQDFDADAPGRSFDSGGQGRHAMEPEQSGRERLREDFARRIGDELEAGRLTNQFNRLIIVAAPAMLGVLRGQLGDPTSALVRMEIDKDMTGQAPEAIARLIDDQ